MAVRAPRQDVEKVLNDLRSAIRMNLTYFVERPKNLYTLSYLGLRVSDVYDELPNLTYADYIKGPEEDRDKPGSDMLWFFKKKICGQLLYIKFKIEYNVDGTLRVLSFHIDEPIPNS